VPTRELVRGRTVHLELGQTIDRDALVATLCGAGYARMPLVEERGEIAVRGGILDVFPPHRAAPVRIELLGDEVESIREFDPASQRSQTPLGHVVSPPPRDLLPDRAFVIERSQALRELGAREGVSARAVDELVDSLLRGHVPPGAEALAPLLLPGTETVFDFLPEDTLVVIDDLEAGRQRMLRYAEESLENYELARGSGRLVCPPDEVALGPDALEREALARRALILEQIDLADPADGAARLAITTRGHAELRAALARSRASETALAPLARRIADWRSARYRIVLSAGSLSHAERLRALLADYRVTAVVETDPRPCWRWSAAGRLEIRVADLSEGFTLPADRLALVTEEEIFGPRAKRRATSHPAWPAGASLESLAQLAPGDYLVHAEHGIGIYRGLVDLELRGVAGEFLRIEYAEQARLFVPVHRISQVQRYAGSDGHVPRIDKLGGETWRKAKKAVAHSLRDLARELLAVHAARELAQGFAFSPRDRLQEEFEATFPYDETPDQLAAIEDTLADMRRERPMDRIVCGDVGYGKTEVAVRAAFRAALDGKQVAVLVPTTILCQQHEETFRERFKGYPVRIEALSRFQTPARAKRVLEGLADGTVDVVIGTHRLLQKNVMFRDLGLLVIDEEHRFGVAHKERIKQLKKTVDVLTLTATPIPRTLQLAFAGLRDLSVIDTPPADRLAIRTQVGRYSEEVMREAILREMRRGGQVFLVHNRVQTIGAMAEMLARTVPEAKVIVAHGQLPERELEKRTLGFMHGQADVLLCTTIIESGVDNPRANTIIVNRADALGLAQLYQLRGRVGRSTQRAYAYLMVNAPDNLSPDARKRLEAIQDLSELGSGFRLAEPRPRDPRRGQPPRPGAVGQPRRGRLRDLHGDARGDDRRDARARARDRDRSRDPPARARAAARELRADRERAARALQAARELSRRRRGRPAARRDPRPLRPAAARRASPARGDPAQDPGAPARRGGRRRRQRRDRAHRRRAEPRRPAAPAAPTHAGRRRHPRDAGPQDPRAHAQGPRAPGPVRRRAQGDDEPGRVIWTEETANSHESRLRALVGDLQIVRY
jgi:transcription-repair coupling factor (superfamily II helicase)